MPVEPFSLKDKDAEEKLKNLIRFVNDLEKPIRAYKELFTDVPGDYPINTVLGVKTTEGKVLPYTAAQILTLLGLGIGGSYITHALCTAENDLLIGKAGGGEFIKKTLAEVKTILGLGTAAYTAVTDYVTHALATAANDFLVASGSGAYVKKTLAEVKTILDLISDAAYGAGWDTDTTHAPSKNAIYDMIESLPTGGDFLGAQVFGG